ncbi:MAG TPA: ABC transporter ATP-binding protein [Mycobacteriales bacterium]|nr:ABC transporter ATP-binding protein [Mycobacteriales bacterium]
MPENLPPVGKRRAAVAMLTFAWKADRTGTLLAFALFGSEAAAQVIFAYWLKLLIDGLRPVDARQLTIAVIGITLSILGGSVLMYAGGRVQATLRERTGLLLNQQMLELVGRTPTLELHENPDHLVQLEALQREGHAFATIAPSLLNFFAICVRIAITTVLLIKVHPLLLVLPLFGIPMLLLSGKIGGLFRLSMELTAEPARRAQHLAELTATSSGAKEVRLFRLGPAILERFHASHREIRGTDHRLQVRAACLGLIARVVFLIGYFAAILFVTDLAIRGRTTVGDTVLVAVLAGQVLGLVTGSAEMLQITLRSLVAAGRYLHLQDIARRARAEVDPAAAVPNRLVKGIRLEGVTYRYPRSASAAVENMTLTLPAGATIAVVGENGAGKSTFVKLLTGMYQPTEGRIHLDRTDLSTIDPDQWRKRVAAAFQDHARFEFLLRETVGLGDLTRADETPADGQIRSALDRAGASDVVAELPCGIATQLGSSWPSGVDLSGGQWQKLAIGRAMMRNDPLLLILDEPTAALDADTEYRLFERWTTAARQLRRRAGTVTVLVSHRFSTVRMADLIVVLDQGRVAEFDNHEQLLRRGGLYAELFELQARAYR